jgi:hypothetical protein
MLTDSAWVWCWLTLLESDASSSSLISDCISVLVVSESELYVTNDGQPASLSWNKASIWGLRPDLYCLCDSCGLVLVGGPLWREDGSVFYICCWPLPSQSFFGPSPLGLASIFYCLTFETSLFVASYDSQGHGGGIRPRLSPWLSLWYIPHSDGLGDTLLKGSVFNTMVAFPCNGLLYMRCRLNAFNCCPDIGARFVAAEPLSSNGRSIILLLGATPQFISERLSHMDHDVSVASGFRERGGLSTNMIPSFP